MSSNIDEPGTPDAGAADAGDGSVDWAARWRAPGRRLLATLERISLAVEKPIARLVRRPHFNPLYYTGTITVFLLIIIAITGVYLTMFYQFGFTQSYQAVARIEASPVGRVIRGLHRYASSLALLMALLHGWRTLFMDRFRGPRWLAWVTGVVLAALVWAGGVTGYWLVNDQRAQVLNQTLVNLLKGSTAGIAFLNRYLTTAAAGSGWVFMLIVFLVHFGLMLAIAVFFVYHIRRLSRAKWMPPRYWLAGLGGILLAAAVAVPAGLLPRADGSRLPGWIDIDLPFLFYLPAALRWPAAGLWGGVLAGAIFVSLFPWLFGRRRAAPVAVDAQRCTGCRLCEQDCPYKAITMVERPEGSHYKFLAAVDPGLCVSCGICVGSCAPLALTLDGRPAEGLWRDVLSAASQGGTRPVKLIFTCERHALQGAAKSLRPDTEPAMRVIPLTCIGMANPNLLSEALAAGAAEVVLVGCPPDDCANREGNLWLQDRLEHKRAPRWKGALADKPVIARWLPPNDFKRALLPGDPSMRASGYQITLDPRGWLGFAPALALVALMVAGLVALSRVPYRPFAASGALVELSLTHLSGNAVQAVSPGTAPTLHTASSGASSGAISGPVRLVLEADGEVVLDRTYTPRGGQRPVAQVFEQVRLAPGKHRLRLSASGADGAATTIYDEAIVLAEGQILSLHLKDQSIGADPVAGERFFNESGLGVGAGCRICHSLQPGVRLVGPSLAGVATRAATQVPGLSAEAYLRQSIVDPDAFIVPGFLAGQMLPDLDEKLTPEQLDDLVAFLMTLTDEGR